MAVCFCIGIVHISVDVGETGLTNAFLFPEGFFSIGVELAEGGLDENISNRFSQE